MTAPRRGPAPGHGSSPGAGLTPAQWDTLRAVARTGNRQEAAAELGVGIHTVSKHLEAAFLALEAADIVSALRAVGWLRVP